MVKRYEWHFRLREQRLFDCDGRRRNLEYDRFRRGACRRFQPASNSLRQYVSGVPGNGGIQLYDARQNLPGIMALAQQCMQAIQTNPGSNNDRGYRWQTGSPGLSLTNIILTPNSQQYPFSGCRWDCAATCGVDFGHLHVPSSLHPGGVNVLFTDGSVRFVKSSVSQMTWMSIGSKNGGEVVSSDSY